MRRSLTRPDAPALPSRGPITDPLGKPEPALVTMPAQAQSKRRGEIPEVKEEHERRTTYGIASNDGSIRAIKPNVYYTANQIAHRLNLSQSTFQHWRHSKMGPAFHGVGRSSLYLGRDVLAWLRSQRVPTLYP